MQETHYAQGNNKAKVTPKAEAKTEIPRFFKLIGNCQLKIDIIAQQRAIGQLANHLTPLTIKRSNLTIRLYNLMAYPIEIKEKATILRKMGYSIKEIARKLNIAQSTSSEWLRNVPLNKKAKERLKSRKIFGQYKASQTWKKKRQQAINQQNQKVLTPLSKIKFDSGIYKLLCSFLFWTEGGKSTDSYVYFINSEPKMVTTFLRLLRLSFPIQEEKLRALVHIHEYHNEPKIKEFWSKITKIPLSQFTKSYNKPNTKKRIRPGYKGSIRIRYYDSKIALELRSFYNMFVERYLGV